MCACDMGGPACHRCVGTPFDDRYHELPQPREDEQDARERLISMPDFLIPLEGLS